MSKIFQTSQWYFLPNNQEIILICGTKVELPSRLSKCLETLMIANGDTVHYDELLLKVWGTEFRESSTISSVISELRKVIGCTNDGTRYIKTVPKKGYRFTCEFQLLDCLPELQPYTNRLHDKNITNRTLNIDITEHHADNDTADHAGEPGLGPLQLKATTTHQQFFARTNLKTIGTGILVFLLVVILLTALSIHFGWLSKSRHHLVLNKASGDDSVVRTDIETLTYEHGLETEFDVTRDRHWLIYTHQVSEDKSKHLRAKNLTSGALHILENQPGYTYASPRFSRDGTKLLYIRSDDRNCEVRLIEFSDQGFDPKSDQLLTSCGYQHGWTTLDFSADGTMVYFSRSDSLTEPYKIYRRDLMSRKEHILTAPAINGRGDYSFTLSPDGRKIAIIRNESWTTSNIVVLNLLDNSSITLSKVPYLLYAVSWFDNETVIYKNKQNAFVRRKLDGNIEIPMTFQNSNLSFPVYRDGYLYAFRGLPVSSKIWLADLEQNSSTYSIKVESAFNDFKPARSSKGLYFLSDRSGSTQIWHTSADALTKLTNFVDNPNINKLLYSEKSGKLYVVKSKSIEVLTDPNGPLSPFAHFDMAILNSSMADDQESIVYTIEENERWYIEKIDLASGSRSRLQTGFHGKIYNGALLFSQFHEKGLYRQDLKTGITELLNPNFDILQASAWAILKNDMVVVEKGALVKYDLQGNELSRETKLNGIRSIDCAHDNHSCVVDNFGFGSSEIVVLKQTKDFVRESAN